MSRSRPCLFSTAGGLPRAHCFLNCELLAPREIAGHAVAVVSHALAMSAARPPPPAAQPAPCTLPTASSVQGLDPLLRLQPAVPSPAPPQRASRRPADGAAAVWRRQRRDLWQRPASGSGWRQCQQLEQGRGAGCCAECGGASMGPGLVPSRHCGSSRTRGRGSSSSSSWPHPLRLSGSGLPPAAITAQCDWHGGTRHCLHTGVGAQPSAKGDAAAAAAAIAAGAAAA